MLSGIFIKQTFKILNIWKRFENISNHVFFKLKIFLNPLKKILASITISYYFKTQKFKIKQQKKSNNFTICNISQIHDRPKKSADGKYFHIKNNFFDA